MPDQSSLFLSTPSLLLQSSVPQQKWKMWRHFLRCILPDSSYLWLREQKLSLFMTSMSSSCMKWWKLHTDAPLPFLSYLKLKYKTQSSRQNEGLRPVASNSTWNPGRTVKKKGNQSRWLCTIVIFLCHSDVRFRSFLQISRVSEIMFSNIVVSEKYYFYQTYIYVFHSLVPSL